MSNATAVQLLIVAELQDTIWGKRIVDAEKRAHFNEADMHEANNNWVSEADDNTHSNVTLNEVGRPEDKVLRDAGSDVTICMYWDDYTGAAEHLIKMQERFEQLKQEMLPA
jgi:hypothetical protein